MRPEFAKHPLSAETLAAIESSSSVGELREILLEWRAQFSSVRLTMQMLAEKCVGPLDKETPLRDSLSIVSRAIERHVPSAADRRPTTASEAAAILRSYLPSGIVVTEGSDPTLAPGEVRVSVR